MPKSITDYLMREHQVLAQLLNELAGQLRVLPLASDAGETLEKLQKLCQEIFETLHTHLEEEERVLYPALEAKVEGISTTLDRMRDEHDTGEAVEEAFLESVARLAQSGRNRKEVMQAGRQYVQWVRGHLLNENARLFPLVERRLDPQVQKEIRRAMEELSQETTARIAEAFPHDTQA